MGFTVRRTVSTASRLFLADEIRGGAPFREDGAQHLAKQFDSLDVLFTTGERPVWRLRKGKCLLGERRITVEQMLGNEHELSVGVDGSTDDALDVLREIWTCLAEFEPDQARRELAIDEVPGQASYITEAVFDADQRPDELFPALATVRSEVSSRLGATGVTVMPDARQFRFAVPFTVQLKGILASRSFVIEPRFTATDSDRVYWCTSPLRSDELLAVLKLLFP